MKVFFFFYCLCDLHFSIFEKTQYRKYTHKISFIERKLKIPSPTTHYFSGILWVIPVTLKQHALRLVVILLVYQCFTNISWKHTLNVSTAFQNTGFLQWMCIFQHIPGLFALFLSKSPCPNPHSWTPFCCCSLYLMSLVLRVLLPVQAFPSSHISFSFTQVPECDVISSCFVLLLSVSIIN